MELVKGVSITEYCDQNSLDTRSRLELIAHVCRAIQHAHQKGVIHRDIKPNNVMVTLHAGKPVPKVIDFGVAKALCQKLTEQTLFTRYGQVIGTPQYMSPEQAEMSGLDVDTRSDIYSLGVLLYELLTGETPLDADSLRSTGFDAMRRMICEHNPVTPSTKLRTLDDAKATSVANHRSTVPQKLSRLVSGDLDWIVMKSLEKDRNRRYETASGLMADIDRYLLNEPVEAGPPTFRYQMSKLYRRHRALMTSIVAAGSALFVVIGLTTWAWASENKQRQVADQQTKVAIVAQGKAQAHAKEAEKQKEVAQREADKANAALSMFQSLLLKAAPSVEDGPSVKLVDFLNGFAENFDGAQFSDSDKGIEIHVRVTLAEALRNFSRFDESNEQLRQAEKLAREIYAANSIDLASSLSSIAKGNKREEAILKDALEIFDANGEQSSLVVNALTVLGTVTGARPDVSEAYLRRAIKLYGELKESQRADVEVLPHRRLGGNLMNQGKLQQSLRVTEESLKLSNLNSHEEHVKTLILMSSLQDLLGKETRAHDFADRATRAANESNNPAVIVRAWLNRLRMEFSNKRYDAKRRRSLALECKEDLVRQWKRMHSLDPAELVGELHGALMTISAADDAAEIMSLSESLSPSSQASIPKNTAQWLRMHGDIKKAIQYFNEQPHRYWNRLQCGRAYAAVRDFEGQLLRTREAIALVTDQTEAWHRLAADFAMANALKQLGRHDESKGIFASVAKDLPQQSKTLWGDLTPAAFLWAVEESRGPDVNIDESEGSAFGIAVRQLHSMTAGSPIEQTYKHAALGMIAERHGKAEEAIRHFILANENRPGTFAVAYAEWITDHMVALLVKTDRLDQAEEILRKDVKRRDSQVSDIHPERAFVRLRLVRFLVDHNRKLDDATSLLDEATKVFEYHADILPAKEKQVLVDLRNQIGKR